MFARFLVALRSAGGLVIALWNGPYWWSAPLVVLLLPTALLFALLHAVPIVAPFVYALF